MLNQDLDKNELAVQLSIARNKISELEEKLIELYHVYKSSETVINVNVDSLYYQIALLRDSNEMFAKLRIKNNKVISVEAASE